MKKKILWIIYYNISAIAIAVGTVMLHQYLTLTWFSLFPIGYVTFALYIGFSNPAKRLRGIKTYYNRKSVFWGWEEVDPSKTEKKINVEIENNIALESEQKSAKWFLTFAPLIAIQIFFFSNITKIIAGLVILTILIFIKICLYDLVYSAKRYREESDALDADFRKEQEEQEFRGK